MFIKRSLGKEEDKISEGDLYKMFKPKNRQIRGGKKLIRCKLDTVKMHNCIAYVVRNKRRKERMEQKQYLK